MQRLNPKVIITCVATKMFSSVQLYLHCPSGWPCTGCSSTGYVSGESMESASDWRVWLSGRRKAGGDAEDQEQQG